VHPRRPLAPAVLLIALSLAVLRGGGESGAASAPVVVAAAAPAVDAEFVGPPTPPSALLAEVNARAEARERAAAQKRRRAAARRAEARRLRRSRSVRGAVRRAWLTHAIGRAEYEGLRSVWFRANRDVGRLRGARRAELAAVVRMASQLAAARKLTPSRLEPVFLTLRRNREFWTTRPLPRPA